MTIVSKQEQDAMRKVCRLAREVLDIAAAELKPGVTTDHIDKVVHEACLERDVGIRKQCCVNTPILTSIIVIPVTTQLLPFPQICVYQSKRSYLPRHSRPSALTRW